MTDPIIDLLYRPGSASWIPRTEEPCGAISGHAPNFKALDNGLVIGLVRDDDEGRRAFGQDGRMNDRAIPGGMPP